MRTGTEMTEVEEIVRLAVRQYWPDSVVSSLRVDERETYKPYCYIVITFAVRPDPSGDWAYPEFMTYFRDQMQALAGRWPVIVSLPNLFEVNEPAEIRMARFGGREKLVWHYRPNSWLKWHDKMLRGTIEVNTGTAPDYFQMPGFCRPADAIRCFRAALSAAEAVLESYCEFAETLKSDGQEQETGTCVCVSLEQEYDQSFPALCRLCEAHTCLQDIEEIMYDDIVKSRPPYLDAELIVNYVRYLIQDVIMTPDKPQPDGLV